MKKIDGSLENANWENKIKHKHTHTIVYQTLFSEQSMLKDFREDQMQKGMSWLGMWEQEEKSGKKKFEGGRRQRDGNDVMDKETITFFFLFFWD